MTIFSLELIKDTEAHIYSVTSATIAKITDRINKIEGIVGSYIANDLRNKLWKQARALELI